ncbi:MAG: helicase-related protein [Candidatus Binatia bacterium]|nr:helicase-related protein [Candidatus Binatia bacterium]
MNPNGSLMVVAANIETARKYTAILKRDGLEAEIATSDDTPRAIKHIKAMKSGTLKIMVAVAMVTEGLDIPSVSHIIYLTNVRTAEWAEQCVCRANRIDPLAGPYETQKGYIFAPADRMFAELAARIEADQCEAVARQKAPADPREAGDGNGSGRPGITPLSSRLIAGQGDLFGYAPPAMAPIPLGHGYQKTQREIERELREEINGMVCAWSSVFGYLPAMLNRKIVGEFGKKRELMTVAELEDLKMWLRQNYEVPEVKPGGIVLEAVPWR